MGSILPLFGRFFMAVLAVFVVGVHKFIHIAFLFKGIMARRTLLDRIPILPNIFPVFVIVVAFGTGDLELLMVFLVGQGDGPFLVCFVSLILDLQINGTIRSDERPDRQKSETSKNNYKKGKYTFFHVNGFLLFSKIPASHGFMGSRTRSNKPFIIYTQGVFILSRNKAGKRLTGHALS